MTCYLVQTQKLDDSNWAEKYMLDFLRYLPDEYTVFRELQVTSTYRERMRGYSKKQPDFVVVAPTIGLLVIEVKDWNLNVNTYEWRDQYRVVKRDRNGQETQLDNPQAQADGYKHAFMELLYGTGVYVTSAVAFPRISKADFTNRIENIDVLRNPQSQFYLDLTTTTFRENLDQYRDKPQELLTTLVNHDPKFQPATQGQIDQVIRKLLPPSFRVGDYTDRQQRNRQVKRISEEQQRWIFGLDVQQNYLLDVAGSGKTNALISRAIHTVDAAGPGQNPAILLTTYNENLERNIRRIFQHKILDSPNREQYQRSIAIHSINALMAQIAQTEFPSTLPIDRQAQDPDDAYESQLREQVELVLDEKLDQFRRFDAIFVDEIQDFDNLHLHVLKSICRSDDFFFVGDIGQKIYERTHNLARIGLVSDRIECPKSYKMYRTPRYIAKLATRFITKDPLAVREFAEHGYDIDGFFYPNHWIKNVAELLMSSQPNHEIIERIRGLLNGPYTEADVMIVASVLRLPEIKMALDKANLPCSFGESMDGKSITLVDFMNVKGLEREIVFVTGIEDLYTRHKVTNLFADEENKYQQELLSRRKVYVSLTRCLDQLIVFYTDRNNRFISDLLEINTQLLNDRQG